MVEISSNSTIAKNTILLYGRMFLLMVVSLYTSRVVLSALGVIDNGIYNIVGGAVGMFSFLNGALSGATSRFLTYELARDDKDRLKLTFATALWAHILMAILVLVLLTMIAFYATSFDSIAYTAASYSYKKIGENEKPGKLICLLWCILLIVLPIALVFSESSMNNIQSVSIISAFPIGIIMILMIWAFFKDARKYMKEDIFLSAKKSKD